MRVLSSVRLAMLLILAIALVVLTGTIVDQAPPGVISDPAAYARWLDTARGKYGVWTDLFEKLQLFNVFHSLLFRALMSLLAASILVCTMRRWRGVWTTVFHTRVRMTRSFLLQARSHSQMDAAMTAPEAAERVRRALQRSHYRVRTETGADSVALFADKNRLSRFGTFLTHLSLILILGGAIAGGVWGFKEPAFVVTEGSARELGLGTGISVRLDRAVNDYYADGRPKSFQSDLTLLENARPVKQGTLLVNSPLRYKGIAFHESYFGQAAVIQVQDNSGRVIFRDHVPLALRSSDGLRPVGRFELPAEGISVLLIGTQAGARDTLVPPGEIRVDVYQDSIRVVRPQNLLQGAPAQLVEGLTFTFERESLFAGLRVVKDPGTTIIWVAGAFLILGMVMLYYLPPRRLWALCTERPDGTTEVVLGMPAQREVSLAGEFERLNERIAGEFAPGAGAAQAQGGE
jgi:cytochrome c biogenesis protein